MLNKQQCRSKDQTSNLTYSGERQLLQVGQLRTLVSKISFSKIQNKCGCVRIETRVGSKFKTSLSFHGTLNE